jgi:intein/homing endonuclease
MARRKKIYDQPIGVGLTTKQMKRRKPLNREFLVNIEPLTENQKRLYDSYAKGKHLVAYGCAGTGKTFITLYNALKEVLDEQTPYEKIYLVRSLVPTREIGFLPGPQPLDAKILTPNGWTTMGQIKVGDYVYGRSGKPTKVLGVYPKGKKLVYKITTTEGTSTECCEDHLWLTKTFENKKRKTPGKVKSTRQIMDTFYNKNGKINHYIPRNDAIEFTEKDIPIPAYTLGVLLGDGSISNSISFCSIDDNLVEKVSNEVNSIDCYVRKSPNHINYTISTKELKSNKRARKIILENKNKNEIIEYDTISSAIKELNLSKYKIIEYCSKNKTIDGFTYYFLEPNNTYQNPIKDKLNQLGLIGKKSYNKFIPDLYKYNSIQVRTELLRGLMDTDGTIKQNYGGNCSYTTTSKQLAEDIIEVVRSLGGRATYKTRNRIGKKTLIENNRFIEVKRITYELNVSLPKNINPFYIERKASRFNPKYMRNIGIKSIEPVCEKEVQCIMVEDPEHLYITDEYIVTHNTHDDKADIYQIPYKNMVKYMFQMPTDSDFEMLYGNLKQQETLKFWSTSFLRGVTLDNCIIIVDEFQNANFHELCSLITRVGENSKIMFCGDASQSDLIKSNERNGIIDFMKILHQMPSFDIIEFGLEDIVRSSLVKEFLTAKHNLGL